ncbi:MAG: ADP-ribosylglycohydrolase family protein, partial [Erythrobacter sp.]|nr:ADP-ribosylglycohydrolase family protein [Erythrobacter sp.]
PAVPPANSLETGGATQLALFTAEGMVRMLVRYHARGIGPAFIVVKHAYDRWLFTQGNAKLAAEAAARWASGTDRWPDGWLIRQHELHHRRSDMSNTVAALRLTPVPDLGDDHHLHPRPNASKGAGGVVRAAYGGLLVTEAFAFEMGVRIAGFTHGHPDAFLSAGAMSAIACRMLAGASLPDAATAMRPDLLHWPTSPKMSKVLDQMVDGEGPSTDASPALRHLVNGAIAFRSAADPLRAVELAAEWGGTASAVVAGQLAGISNASAWSPVWRDATDVSRTVAKLAEAVSIAHRAWMMDRTIPGADWKDTDDIFAAHPVSNLLWRDYPGW